MKAFFRKLLCIITAAIMVSALCTVPASAATLKLSKSSVNLPIGYVATLKVKGAKGNVKWSSNNSDIAYVKSTSSKNDSAVIKGKKAGTTYIYAKVDGKTLKCKIVVRKSFISASSENISIEKGASKKITLTVSGSKKISASNSNKNAASVSFGKWNGDKITLTIKGKKAGTAKIKVYAKGTNNTVETITVKVKDSSAKAEKKTSASASNDIDAMIQEVFEIVNQERTAAGKDPLTLDQTLLQVADIRAEELLQKYSHDRPDGSSCFTAFNDAGIVNVYMGENIAAGQKSAEQVMDDWMNSPGHRQNILSDDFTRIGIGLRVSNNGYKYYWVQVFTSDF